MAQHYIKILKTINSNLFKVISVVDKDIKKAKEFSEKFGCDYHERYDEILKIKDKFDNHINSLGLSF